MTLKNILSSKKQYKYSSHVDKQPNLKLWSGIAIAVLVLILIIIFNPFKSSSGSNFNVNVNVSAPEKSNETVCDDLCMFKAGIENKSADICTKIDSDALEQECYEKISAYSWEACLLVEDVVKNTDCIIANAVAQKSTDLCNHISDENSKKVCISQADPCYFKTGFDKQYCLAVSQKSISYCQGNSTCVLAVAKELKDFSLCQHYLNDTASQTACQSYVVDKDQCTYLPFQDQIDKCRSEYSILSKKKWVCDQINLEREYALLCQQQFAIMERNQSYCKALNTQFRIKCDTNYSANTGDMSGCLDIPDYALNSRGNCNFEAARATGNPSFCSNLVGTGWNFDICYSISIFQNTTGLPKEYCYGVIHEQWKDKCFTYSAYKTNDSSICTKIQSSSEKFNCYNKLGITN